MQAADWCKSSRCVSTADCRGRGGSRTRHSTASLALASEDGSRSFIYTTECSQMTALVLSPNCLNLTSNQFQSHLTECIVYFKRQSSRCHIIMHALTLCPEGRKQAIRGVFLLCLWNWTRWTLHLSCCCVVLFLFLCWEHHITLVSWIQNWPQCQSSVFYFFNLSVFSAKDYHNSQLESGNLISKHLLHWSMVVWQSKENITT